MFLNKQDEDITEKDKISEGRKSINVKPDQNHKSIIHSPP